MTTEDGRPDVVWQQECAVHLKRFGPASFDQLVLGLQNLHSGWPALTPEQAAEAFL